MLLLREYTPCSMYPLSRVDSYEYHIDHLSISNHPEGKHQQPSRRSRYVVPVLQDRY